MCSFSSLIPHMPVDTMNPKIPSLITVEIITKSVRYQGEYLYFRYPKAWLHCVSENLSLNSLTARHANSRWFCLKLLLVSLIFAPCRHAKDSSFHWNTESKSSRRYLRSVSSRRDSTAHADGTGEIHFIGSFEELDWARARPSSIDAFAHSLTTTEAKFLESYRKSWPAQVYQLNQKRTFRFWCNLAGMGLGYRDQQLRLDVRGSGKQVDAADGSLAFQLQEGRADVLTLRDAGWQFHALFPNDGDPAFHFGEYS